MIVSTRSSPAVDVGRYSRAALILYWEICTDVARINYDSITWGHMVIDYLYICRIMVSPASRIQRIYQRTYKFCHLAI